MGPAQLLEFEGVPRVHELRLVEVAHVEPVVVVEAAGGKVTVPGDAGFAEEGPTRNGGPHRLESPRVARFDLAARFSVLLPDEVGLAVERERVDFVEVGLQAVNEGLHLDALFPVVGDVAGKEPRLVVAGTAQRVGVDDVFNHAVKQLRVDAGYLGELLGVGVVEGELEGVEPGFHAGLNAGGCGDAAVGGEEYVAEALVLGFLDEQREVWAQHGFAEEEDPDFLDARPL